MVRTAGRSAPYGQACLSCFKMKCKCIPRLEGNGCERSVWDLFEWLTNLDLYGHKMEYEPKWLEEKENTRIRMNLTLVDTIGYVM